MDFPFWIRSYLKNSLVFIAYFCHIIAMSESSRICINLPKDLEEELRVLHADMISKTRKNISFSKFFSYILRELVTEKKKMQWYGKRDCTIVHL